MLYPQYKVYTFIFHCFIFHFFNNNITLLFTKNELCFESQYGNISLNELREHVSKKNIYRWQLIVYILLLSHISYFSNYNYISWHLIAVYYCEKRYDDCKAIHEATISFITLLVVWHKRSLYKNGNGTYCKKYVW